MRVIRLDLRNLRRFEAATLAPGPRINLLLGGNGAGKTSVLEALHLMAYGRSFRGRVRDGLVRAGADALEVFVEWQEQREPGGTRLRKAGLRHSGHDWTGRLDGEAVNQLGDLCAALAVVSFEPGSHALITGGGEARRRYLDWGLFHVEPAFLALWRRYSRALRQRNALLKTRGPSAAQLDAWDCELAEAGDQLGRYRAAYLQLLEPQFQRLAAELAPMLGDTALHYLPGWRRDELPLADALLLARERDLSTGHTSVGPHRADWRIEFGLVPGRDALSRGQAKLAALSALLAQARHHAERTRDWPVVVLDDLASELDREHQERVLAWLAATDAQVFISGTDRPAALARLSLPALSFHVERGELRVDGT
jgi:DNA replication and repair protein RecF